MLYIDFDGVILDTDGPLFEDWRKITDHKLLPESEKIKYIQERDWDYVLHNSNIINDAIYYLKQMDPETSAILTRVHSLENEAFKKVKWTRGQGVKQKIIIVPYTLKKTDIVDAKGNTLVDDSLFNCDHWEECGGHPIFFDFNDDNLDNWNKPNIKGYQKVRTLKDIDRSKNENNRI